MKITPNKPLRLEGRTLTEGKDIEVPDYFGHDMVRRGYAKLTKAEPQDTEKKKRGPKRTADATPPETPEGNGEE